MDKKTKTHSRQEENTTGTYVFDKKLGKVVKVSGRIPSVSSKAKGGDFSADAPMPPCGQGSCPSAGACGMGGMGGGFGMGDF